MLENEVLEVSSLKEDSAGKMGQLPTTEVVGFLAKRNHDPETLLDGGFR
jgi:hypothetical protein